MANKFSIITVVYNGASTIARCMESVGSQKGADIEHILIDGCSTDATLQILENYRNQISIQVSEPDEGIYDAMNKGIKLATGDIIGILNCDDIYSNDTVLAHVALLMEDQNIDAIYGDLVYFSPNAPQKVHRTYRSKLFSPDKLGMGLMPAHPTLFLRKRIYDKFGLFDSSYRIGGDFEFIARIFKDKLINYLYVPEVMVGMQIGGISTSGMRNTLLLIRENLRACRANQIPSSYLKLLSRYPRKFLEYF